MVLDRLGGVVGKPAAIQTGGIGFRRASEVPAVVPNFHPGVIAPLVKPQRCGRDTSGNTDGPAGIDQQNRKPRAGGDPAFEGFERTLVGATAFGRIANTR